MTKGGRMPHVQRKRSETGFYHVVVKGDGDQIIFESDADRKRFITELEGSVDSHDVDVHAYCLMSNHVHFLVSDRDGKLSAFMKQLNERYAMYFRKVTGRVGHVFQGRFWSEPVESDEYFLAALRYIHANPEPAGICSARDYRWSSYAAYTGKDSLTNTDLALELLGGPAGFERFQASGGSFAQPFPGSKLVRHLSYDELTHIAVEVLGRDTLNSLKAMPPKDRGPHIEKLSRAGFTDTQIARITGVGQAVIYRALHKS